MKRDSRPLILAALGTLLMAANAFAQVNGPPTGTVIINAGLPEMTRSRAVQLTLTAAGDGGPIRMCISNTGKPACTTWPTFTAPTMTKKWTLASGSGIKTVNVWFRDQSGTTTPVTTPHSDTILLDTMKPANGPVSVTPGNQQLTLSWDPFRDNPYPGGSGVVEYRAVFLKGSTPPLSCAAGTRVPDYDGTSTTLVHTTLADGITRLTNGMTYAYRICAVDAVGNMSAGATKTGKPIAEPDPPTGTVTINRGAVATRRTAATLTIEAHDATNGPIRMCISNRATCSSWTTYTPSATTGNMTRSWKLTRGNGTKTVNVRFRDRWGNTSQTPESDTIILDTMKPANGKVSVTPGNQQLTLNWAPFPDNPGGSGVVEYRAVFLKGSTPPLSCAAGTRVPDYDGTSTTLVHTTLADGITRLANGTTYAYRVCAIDAAGNISTGATVTGKPVAGPPPPPPPDTTPPTGTVAINGGAAATNSTAATLALTAVDDGSGAIEMCISNTATCSDWAPFETAPGWTLAAGDGIKTVNVWYRDEWGNPSATPNSDTILLDTTAPTDGTVAATPGDTQLTLNWSGFADTPGSGITGYQVVFQQGGTPGSCASGTPVPGYVSPATTLVHPGLLNGTTYGYRVCAIDAVGFISLGATATGQPAATPPPDTTAPTGTVTINGGAAATNSTLATLTLTAADDGGGAIGMCISNTATCGSWTAFEPTPGWTLAGGDGTATVNVWFRDQLGNASATPSSDTILLDTTAPADGTVTVAIGVTQQLTLNWSGFADPAGSGVAGYLAVFQEGGAPASCDAGTEVPGYAGAATTLVHDGLVDGTMYGYRICAIDAAGNVSAGATATCRPMEINFDCVGCHNGNEDYPLAPNVMKYWDGSWWDSNRGGSDSKQQGGHGDPDHLAPRQCLDCHDITLPPGTHLDGVYNSIWGDGSGTRNANTAHLKASFIGGTAPAWSVQLTLDAACWGCHQTIGGIVDWRHEKDGDPASGVNAFGTRLTESDGDALPLPVPNNQAWPGPYPVDQDISTNASGSTFYAPCISCHDPHGTGAMPKPSASTNRMLRDDISPTSTLCKVCHL